MLALQESLGEHNDHFQQALTAAFPGWHAVRYDELLMLSRFPIVSAGPVRFPHSPHALLRAVLAVEDRRLTLLDVHLETIGAVASASDIRLGRGLVERLKRRDAVRRDGTVLLTGLARQTSGPLLVAGDFNLPPRGPLYRQLSGTFSNAFAARGWGFGFTHAARLPWGRIDHLWLHGAVRAESAWAAAVVASDHRPLVADVRLR